MSEARSLRRPAGATRLLAAATLICTAAMASVSNSVPAESSEVTALAELVAQCNVRSGVSGSATNRLGDPLVGAQVTLFAELEHRGRVALPVLARSRTDRNGCYALPLVANRRLFQAADRFGVMNLQVMLQDGNDLQVAVLNLDLHLGRQGEPRVLPAGSQKGARGFRPAHATPGLEVVGGAHVAFGPQADAARQSIAASAEVVRTHGLVGSGTLNGAEVVQQLGPAPDRIPLPESVTGEITRGTTVLVKVYRKHPVLVGQWFSTHRRVHQEWRYSQGATSTLASALKIAGGVYEESQTYSKSTSATIGFPDADGRVGQYYRSYFRYAKDNYYYCDGVSCGWVGSRVKPYDWQRGTQVIRGVRQIKINPANCSRYARGSKDWSRGSEAIEWSNGVLVTGDFGAELSIGISLSAQTGFTSDAENFVLFKRRGRLCGWGGPLGATPRILAARPWR